jgi:hypothetical protein
MVKNRDGEKGKILEPDRSCANSPGNLDVLAIALTVYY